MDDDDDVLWMMRDGLWGWQGNTASLGSSSHYVIDLMIFYFILFILFIYLFFLDYLPHLPTP